MASVPGQPGDREGDDRPGHRQHGHRPPPGDGAEPQPTRQVLVDPLLHEMEQLQEAPTGNRHHHADHRREHQQGPVTPAPEQRSRIRNWSCASAGPRSGPVRPLGSRHHDPPPPRHPVIAARPSPGRSSTTCAGAGSRPTLSWRNWVHRPRGPGVAWPAARRRRRARPAGSRGSGHHPDPRQLRFATTPSPPRPRARRHAIVGAAVRAHHPIGMIKDLPSPPRWRVGPAVPSRGVRGWWRGRPCGSGRRLRLAWRR